MGCWGIAGDVVGSCRVNGTSVVYFLVVFIRLMLVAALNIGVMKSTRK